MPEFNQLKCIVEAALLASSQPLSLPQLFSLFAEQEQPAHDDLARALDELARDTEGRGVELKEVASGFRYQVRQDVNPWVSRLWTERQTRYSRALLETLSLIAYRQPITRGEIEQIRGVAVSSNIIKTLEEREWVRVVGYRDVPGKPELFGTTRQFLDYFNLKSLDELPPLAEIRDLSDYDPQLGLAPVAIEDGAIEDGAIEDGTAEGDASAESESGTETPTDAGGPEVDVAPDTEKSSVSAAEHDHPVDTVHADASTATTNPDSSSIHDNGHAAEGDATPQTASDDDARPVPTEHTA